jgi:D-glycero-D-manno-heptose 1,7-bisphosphate phosphatase
LNPSYGAQLSTRGRTVFLDRDGTINEPAAEGDYIRSPDEVELLPGAAEAIRLLNELPTKVVVVTNQRGIALGLMSEADLAAVNTRLEAFLAAEGAHLDAILHCPHERGECECRKPGTAMFERAAREIPGVTLEGAAMIGDSAIDVEAGNRLGLTTVRLGPTTPGETSADHEAADLLAAVKSLTATS